MLQINFNKYILMMNRALQWVRSPMAARRICYGNFSSEQKKPQTAILEDWQYVEQMTISMKKMHFYKRGFQCSLHYLNNALSLLIQSHLNKVILDIQIYNFMFEEYIKMNLPLQYFQLTYKLYRDHFKPHFLMANWMKILINTKDKKLKEIIINDYKYLNLPIPQKTKPKNNQTSSNALNQPKPIENVSQNLESEENRVKTQFELKRQQSNQKLETQEVYYRDDEKMTIKEEKIQIKHENMKKEQESLSQQQEKNIYNLGKFQDLAKCIQQIMQKYATVKIHDLEIICERMDEYEDEDEDEDISNQNQNQYGNTDLNPFVIGFNIKKITIKKIQLSDSQNK